MIIGDIAVVCCDDNVTILPYIYIYIATNKQIVNYTVLMPRMHILQKKIHAV